MTAQELLRRELNKIPDVRSETAAFLRMNGTRALVNIGESTIALPCQGWYPPVAGMAVQVEWRAGRGVVTGPAAVQNPIGTITGVGTPQAQVTVNGIPYMLYIRSGYTPVMGHTVTVNWATGTIEGQITGVATPTPPSEQGPPTAQRFADLGVRAWKSGRYQSSWWSTDPRASNSNDGIWVYGTRNQDALKGANVEKVFLFLPLVKRLGNCSIGLHSYSDIPGGAPSIGSLVALPLDRRSGWVELPSSWGNWLRDNPGGIGVTAPGGGDNIWQGVPANPLSGCLSFSGTR